MTFVSALVGFPPPVAIAIVAVVLLNAGFAFIQERQAERAVEALAAFLPARARVVRDGRAGQRDAATLVPGDVILVGEGDRISADARLLEGEVEVDMSALTGESVPVAKGHDAVPEDAPLAERESIVYAGTGVTRGSGDALVVATGVATEQGAIASLTQQASPPPTPACPMPGGACYRLSRCPPMPRARSGTRTACRSACPTARGIWRSRRPSCSKLGSTS